MYVDLTVKILALLNKGSEVGGTEEEALILMESIEVWISSSEERREVESRSELKILPSWSSVGFEEPQSMR